MNYHSLDGTINRDNRKASESLHRYLVSRHRPRRAAKHRRLWLRSTQKTMRLADKIITGEIQ